MELEHLKINILEVARMVTKLNPKWLLTMKLS